MTHPEPVRYEKTDVQEGAIVKAGIILGVVTVMAVIVVLVVFRAFLAREIGREPPPPPLAQAPGREAPEPRLQERPAVDVIALRKQEQDVLTSYGWIDERRGVVHIPIEDAMHMLSERGLPLKAASPTPAPPPAAGAQREKK